MNDPDRWLQSNDAPPEMRDLLRHAKRPAPMSAAIHARSAAQLSTRLASTQGASVSATGAGFGAKGLALVVTIGLAAITAMVVVRSMRSRAVANTPTVHATHNRGARTVVDAPPAVVLPPPAPIGLPALTPVSPSINTAEAPSVPPSSASNNPRAASPRETSRTATGSARPASTARTVAPTAEPPATRETPATNAEPAVPGEASLLARAQSLLSRDPSAAMRALGEHETHYPNGSMVDARDAMTIEALRRLSRNAEARERALVFLRRFPRSVYAPRVQTALDDTH